MDYITPDEMKAVEINSEYHGVPVSTLMENAGRQVFLALKGRVRLRGRSVTVYCGTGNNGGDGLVAARYLSGEGADVSVVLIGKSVKSREARKNLETVKALLKKAPAKSPDVIIDAILGTGIKGDLRGPVLTAVRKINRSNAFKLSVDVPTGLKEGNGTKVEADLIVTFHQMKEGLKSQNTVVADIGVPDRAREWVGPGDLIVNLKRSDDSHKGQNGKVLIIGGSDMFHGAPLLSGAGALSSGADLVFFYVPGCNFDVTKSFSPDFIVRKYDGDYLAPEHSGQIVEFAKMCDSLVIGPGLGEKKETTKAVIEILEGVKIPVVIDADAISPAGKRRGILKKIDAVITPHTREFSYLTGEELPPELNERIKQVSMQAKRLSSVILLKSRADIIASPEKVRMNTTGNSGMTVGGTGDVLSGLVSGLISQGIPLFESGACGAFVNGSAGDELSRWKGHAYTASDVAGEIPHTISRILNFEPVQ
ncbi:MAG: NAD(P)H-hydrate dehydratase [Candidatus Hydrothermarchaeaceae archaeon]